MCLAKEHNTAPVRIEPLTSLFEHLGYRHITIKRKKMHLNDDKTKAEQTIREMINLFSVCDDWD